MDEQVIQDLYNRARGKGYLKGIEDFKNLLATDDEVVDDNYRYVKSKGYTKSRDEFLILVGVSGQTQPTVTETVTETVVEEPKKKKISLRNLLPLWKSNLLYRSYSRLMT